MGSSPSNKKSGVHMLLWRKLAAEFSGTLWLVLGGCGSAGLASNGYGAHSPGGYSQCAALITEIVMRSTGPALIVGDQALSQLWLFWVAPLAGAAIAGFVYRTVFEKDQGQRRPAT
jgi:Major intrinsic protein